MSVNWSEVLATLGSTVAVAGAMAWLAKAIATHMLTRDIELHKSKLKTESDKSLKTHEADLRREVEIQLANFNRHSQAALLKQKSEFDQKILEYQARISVQSAQQERVRQAVERWANPILGAVRDLNHRIKNILENNAYVALSRNDSSPSVPDWSMRRDYFEPSTVFLFAQYFCWTRLLQEKLTFDLFRAHTEKDAFLTKLRAVEKCLSSWPFDPLADLPVGDDSQVFALQQRAIGEALIDGEQDAARCMRCSAFLERWEEPEFREKFSALVNFVGDLTPAAARRWRRLQHMSVALGALEQECVQLLSPVQPAAT